MGDEDLRIEAKLDFGPHTQVRLKEQIENVPVTPLDGDEVIGKATVHEDGRVDITLTHTVATDEIFAMLRTGMADSISIVHNEKTERPVAPMGLSYSDEVRRRFDAANSPHREKD